MKRISSIIAISSLALTSYAAEPEPNDTVYIPLSAKIVTGNHNTPSAHEMIGVFYDTSESYFNDPGAPRFLFLDKQGKVALGIGGQIYGTLQYDFDGSIDDGSNFTTYDIPVPNDPARRQAFSGDASHSSIFFKLIGRTSRFGFYQAYVQTNFTGGGVGSYNLKLKQAYLKLGYVTVGLTNSVFSDPDAAPPTIDTQGPAGQVAAKNVILKYAPKFKNGLSLGVSVEVPKVSYDESAGFTEKIAQRVPDIPAYVQYSWDGGTSHVRLSGLLRTMSYRDLQSQKNRFATGWAVQLSGVSSIASTPLTAFWQAAYGAGYANYLNDLSCGSFDLIAAQGNSGRMEAPNMMGLVAGLQYQFSPKFLASCSYSYSRIYDAAHLGDDTYKHAQYLTANLFYNIITDLRCGIEYDWGQRTDYSGTTGHANRLMALIQFQF